MSCYDYPDLISIERALELLRQSMAPVSEAETVSITECHNRVLFSDISSPCDVPNYDSSAMDGYAYSVERCDTSKPIEVIGESFAGHPFQESVADNCCVRIMTGAKIPLGCNTVVMQENTQREGNSVYIRKQGAPGDNIRLAGNDIKAGKIVLKAGAKLGPLEVAMLATLGISALQVFRKVRVGIFSTGDEITPLGDTLQDGFIYDSNRYLLDAALQRLNIEVLNLGIIPDDPQKIRAAFEKAANQCDAVISSGGVSVGEADFTRDILQTLGDITFYKLAMKPGKPFAFGTLNSTQSPTKPAYFFGLPGNPVSTAVTFHILTTPSLKHLCGEEFPDIIPLKAVCKSPLKKRPGRIDFQRGIMTIKEEGVVVESTGNQSSGALSSMIAANCYIRLEKDRGSVSIDETVDVIPFGSIFH